MATETSGTNEILSATANAISELTDLMLAVDEDKVNTIPYDDSWTAPQLLTHVTKSINGMAKDFSNKLKSPDFIVPEEGPYERQPTIDKLNRAFNQFKENTNNANLNDLVEGLPLGPITKLEIIHFVLYHTQRHLHQMKKICEALKNK